MLASRLLSILMLLQARGSMSARALAAEFEVSPRTIHRDIDQLSAAGVPVYAERGRGGGFRLLDGYRTNLTGFTQSEAEALFLAGLPGPAAQLGLADVLNAARLKLLAALPSRVQPEAERIASRLHLDATAWFRDADLSPSLPVVARAVWSGHYLKLNYKNGSALYPRKLGPLGLVLKGGVWYLVAQSGNMVRTYRVASMLDAAITDESFTRPKKFDLAAYWERSARDYEAATYRGEVKVRLSPKGFAGIGLLGPHVADRAKRTAGKPDKRSWITCTLPVESEERGISELMRLGAEAVILGPPALRAAMGAKLAAMARRYGGFRARHDCMT